MREDRIGFVTGALAALALVGWMAGGVAAHEDAKPGEAKAACCAKADTKCCGEGAECCASGETHQCCGEGHSCAKDMSCCKGHAKADGKACCGGEAHGDAKACGSCCAQDGPGKETR
jgi:hypothetical protein